MDPPEWQCSRSLGGRVSGKRPKPGTGTFILGGQMKTLIAGLALVVGLVGCDSRGGTRDTGRVDAADTTVTTRTTQDTTIVTADTSVDVDTTVKEGDVKRPAHRTGRDTATSR